MDDQTEILFDALANEGCPTEMFGNVLSGPDYRLARDRFDELVTAAGRRVHGVFAVHITPDVSGVSELDRIVNDMWDTGWSPNRGSFDRFVSDIGALYSRAFDKLEEFVLVARSPENLNHLSFWSASADIEYFPFHKVAKALRNKDGESLVQMYESALSYGQA